MSFKENDKIRFVNKRANKPMRALTLVGAVILMGLASACETTDAGLEPVDTTAGPVEGDLGGLANDAVVRIQVEDYQKHLNEVILAYRFCVRASALELDDGSASPDLVIERAQRRCEDEYRTAHRTASLLGDIGRISSLRAESQAAAMESLMAARSPS
ncbi:MAG: hypothetical protein ACFCVH_08115 [Alphaproteobacteria bacterium]